MATPTVDSMSRIDDPAEPLTPAELEQFQQDGFVICRDLADERLRREMLHITLEDLGQETAPIEFEADLQYPGSPNSMSVEGGRTVRRLKQAHSRGFVFTEWIVHPEVIGRLRKLLGPDLVMPLAHHNCIMTKQPRFSSDTGWHQDIRYWSFRRPELISVWLALGQEQPENGCLRVIPGSHLIEFDRGRLDKALFLRPELPANRKLIEQSVDVHLEPGDVLFFHSRTVHSASRNHTLQPKVSVVFTYRAADNPPTPGTRSASLPEMLIPSP